MKGTTVQLVKEVQTGTDPFGKPITEPQLIDVPDVLVGQPSTDDVTTTLQMYGKVIAYSLGIPKGDTNDWTDAEVIVFGDRFRTIGFPITAEQANVPLRWGKVVKVEHYG